MQTVDIVVITELFFISFASVNNLRKLILLDLFRIKKLISGFTRRIYTEATDLQTGLNRHSKGEKREIWIIFFSVKK